VGYSQNKQLPKLGSWSQSRGVLIFRTPSGTSRQLSVGKGPVLRFLEAGNGAENTKEKFRQCFV